MVCKMINCVAFLATCGIVRSSINVAPFMVASVPGLDIKFICTDPDNGTRDIHLEWAISNSSHENLKIVIPSSGRIQAVNGTLTIFNVTLEDSNTYTCTDTFSNETETGVLKVYTMPSYLTEGLIIGSICAALIIVLVVGSIISFTRQRQQRKHRLLETNTTSLPKMRYKYKKAIINH